MMTRNESMQFPIKPIIKAQNKIETTQPDVPVCFLLRLASKAAISLCLSLSLTNLA